MTRIAIKIAGIGEATAELDDRNPRIAGELIQRLPLMPEPIYGVRKYILKSLGSWMMRTPVRMPTLVIYPIGLLGLPFASSLAKPKPYSSVNHLGKVVEGIDLFKKVEEGDRIVLSRK